MDKLNIQISYLKRSRRATLKVFPNSQIKLTVPMGISTAEINQIIKSKLNWIFKKQKFFEKIPRPQKIQLINGAMIPFLGKKYELKIGKGKNDIQCIGSSIQLSLPTGVEDSQKIKNKLFKWYREEALLLINERVGYFASKLKVHAKTVSLKNYKSRWGTCTSRGDLIFNWQIILLDPTKLDYIVAHELCHLREMNHSQKFYNLLAQLGFDKKQVHREMRYLKNFY